MTLMQKTIKNIGITFGSIIITKFIYILSIVILARLLTPSDFGLVGISTIVIGIVLKRVTNV